MEGEAAIRQRLVDQHLGLVRAIAIQVRRQLSNRLEVDDLIGYGAQGLLEASERFDERFGVTFATFSYHRIRGAIYDGLRRMGQLPRSEYAKVKLAERANAYLASCADRELGSAAAGQVVTGSSPTVAAEPTPEDDLRAMFQALQGVATTFVASLDAAEEQGAEFASDAAPADAVVEIKQMGSRVRSAIATLPDKERHFIEKHYFEGKTLQEAGVELGLSKSWASRLHARAVDLLRDALGDD